MDMEMMKQKAAALPKELTFYRACLEEGIDFVDGAMSGRLTDVLNAVIKHGAIVDVTKATAFASTSDLDRMNEEAAKEIATIMEMGLQAEADGDEELNDNISSELSIRCVVQNSFYARCLAVVRNLVGASISLTESQVCHQADEVMGPGSGKKASEALAHATVRMLNKVADVEQYILAHANSDPDDSLSELNQVLMKMVVGQMRDRRMSPDEISELIDEAAKDVRRQFNRNQPPSKGSDGWDYRIDE